MGVYGEILYPLSDLEVCTRIGLKPSNDRGELELDRARSENNIAENVMYDFNNHLHEIKKISAQY